MKQQICNKCKKETLSGRLFKGKPICIECGNSVIQGLNSEYGFEFKGEDLQFKVVRDFKYEPPNTQGYKQIFKI